MSQTAAARHSPWDPLRISTFRWLWLATLVSNTGTWMHEVGAGWLMTSLNDSPVMVALVQTATTLPAVFLLMPSGALSDILDRRLYLLCANLGMSVVALSLGLLTLSGAINDWGLLGMTFLLGIGLAMIMPAWQAIIPEVVPRTALHGAVALNTLGMNMSRVLGPLVAGVIIAASGSGAVFILNALSFLFIITVLAVWKREPTQTRLPPERLGPAIRTGLRHARHSPALRATIYRGVGFFFFASVMWALLPLIARDHLGGGPRTLGSLFAAISVGAIISALLLPRFRARLNNDLLITLAALLFAAAMTVTALVPVIAVALPALGLCGAAWITVMTCSQVSAQTALPNWVRSRGLAVFLTFFMGSLAAGPFLWGNVAKYASLPAAMILASAGAAIASLLTRRWPISGNDKLDHSPASLWPQPGAEAGVEHGAGPVMVTLRYRVAEGREEEFLARMAELGASRRRHGAFQWDILRDTSAPGCYLEYFMMETWLDHLRQHERISRQDEALQQAIQALLAPGSEAELSRYVRPLIPPAPRPMDPKQ